MAADSNLPGGLAVVANLKIRPDKLDEFRQAIGPVALETRQEPDCFLYELLSDPKDPESFVLLERWKDAEALKHHLTLPHAAAFMGLLPGFLAGPPEMRRLAPLKF